MYKILCLNSAKYKFWNINFEIINFATEPLQKNKTGNKTEAQAIFLTPFTICSSCKWKFFVCPFVVEETKGSYPGVTGLTD